MIALIDADAFYASCELSRHPEWRGRPVMVLGKLGSCILAKNQIAKNLGITTAMPLWEAKKICPNGVYAMGDFRFYELMSQRLFERLREWSPRIEVSSIDEAYMDLEGLPGLFKMSLETIGDRIREETERNLGITVSVGISVNKVLAKMASESEKPNGTRLILPAEIPSFLNGMALEDVPGIAKKRAAKLRLFKLNTAQDFALMHESQVIRLFGKSGLLLWRELHGHVSFPLEDEKSAPKSIIRTSSFETLTRDPGWVRGMAVYHLERALEALDRYGQMTGELTWYLRDKAFNTYGLPCRFEQPTDDFYTLVRALKNLNPPAGKIWRSSGVILTRLSPASGVQISLFDDPEKRGALERLKILKKELKERFGRSTLTSAATLCLGKKPPRTADRLSFVIE